MKHRKTILRLTGIIFVISMLLTSAVPLFADTVIDYVLYTDIRTYIDGVEISSYNINGYTAVVVEDLAFYGFDVIWNGSARTLTAKRTVGKPITGSAVSSTSGGKVGTRAMPVYATDIRTYFDGVEFKSYNVGGKTIVYVDDLANKYSSSYDWNQSAKTLKMGLSDKALETPGTPERYMTAARERRLVCRRSFYAPLSPEKEDKHYDQKSRIIHFRAGSSRLRARRMLELRIELQSHRLRSLEHAPLVVHGFQLLRRQDDVQNEDRRAAGLLAQAR